MLQVHKAGRTILRSTLLTIFLVNFYLLRSVESAVVIYAVASASLIIYLALLLYFRIPSREEVHDKKGIVSPVDAFSLKTKQDEASLILVLKSHFWNARGVWLPCDVKVIAMDKTVNEAGLWVSSYQFETLDNTTFTMRIIGSSSSKSFLNYPQVGETLYQGDPLGFIYFGATVEIVLPTSYQLKYLQGDPLYAKQSVLARASVVS